jgi:hypothetical protein
MDIMEEWRPVNHPDFENRHYEVSNLGEIRNTETNYILKSSNNGNGYLYYTFRFDGNKKNYYVHRLVGLTFLENPNNLSEIDHKNAVRDDNRAINLRWCSRKENARFKPTSVGAIITFDKNINAYVVRWDINERRYNYSKTFKDYLEAEQFYFEKCADCEWY